MLQHLYIKDLAVVLHMDIAFHRGMTVITGETGAGKSILLDALCLALGERSDSQLVRPKAEKAEIAATFDITSLPGAILWLADLELTSDDTPQQCMIRRILYANGRSRAFINGRPATTQQLRLLGEHLVQIHGQHQHQSLLKPAEQLSLLDAFGQHDAMVSQVKTAHASWEKIQRQLHNLQQNGTLERARIDLLHYQIAELDALQLGPDELSQLYLAHDKLAHATQLSTALEQALDYIERFETTNALKCITGAQFALKSLGDKFKSLKNINACLETASIQLKEAAIEINHAAHQLEINPEKQAEIAQRLQNIHDMARKHKVDPTQLEQHHAALKAESHQFSDLEETLEQLTQDLQLAKQQYHQVAVHLSAERKKAATKLAQAVTETIRQLGMPGAVFTVELIPWGSEELHIHGHESVTFGISANPGHPPQPLAKVASGGELSRVSLALELITATFLATPCLIFDEVDVGISGKIGAIVGQALRKLSKSAQVLCVTHLPQVAALGDHHLQVVKTRSEDSTQTEIRVLAKAERVEEIARMLGGLDVTQQARAHAKQLMLQKEDSKDLVS